MDTGKLKETLQSYMNEDGTFNLEGAVKELSVLSEYKPVKINPISTTEDFIKAFTADIYKNNI